MEEKEGTTMSTNHGASSDDIVTTSDTEQVGESRRSNGSHPL
jgi:hypothetical protein